MPKVDQSQELAEQLQGIASSIAGIGHAIVPEGPIAGHDAAGGLVISLTEAVMGVTAGLMKIAAAISDLADAVREHKPNDE